MKDREERQLNSNTDLFGTNLRWAGPLVTETCLPLTGRYRGVRKGTVFAFRLLLGDCQEKVLVREGASWCYLHKEPGLPCPPDFSPR